MGMPKMKNKRIPPIQVVPEFENTIMFFRCIGFRAGKVRIFVG